MKTENAFVRIENLCLTRDEFFGWITSLPHVRKEFIESKTIQTIEYWINSFRLATKVNQYGRKRTVLRSEKIVYPETYKEARSLNLVPPVDFV